MRLFLFLLSYLISKTQVRSPGITRHRQVTFDDTVYFPTFDLVHGLVERPQGAVVGGASRHSSRSLHVLSRCDFAPMRTHAAGGFTLFLKLPEISFDMKMYDALLALDYLA
jgi:hypothetical protein